MSNLDILEVALYNIRDKLELFYNLFKSRLNQVKLYEWLNIRQSNLKCIGDELLIPEKKYLPEFCKPEYFNNDTIIVGHYKLRVKASGGKVGSSWKINLEFSH